MFPTAAEMTADLNDMTADLSDTLVWGSQSVAVIASDLTTAATVEMDGVMMALGVQVTAIKARFTGGVYPPINALVTLNGTQQRVVGVTKSPDGVSVVLQLDRPGA
jgi:hypothetical protein